MVRKPRGSYAGLICLRCRARKIKCILPDGVQPSNVPQSEAHSCQRCRQNGFECVVDSTTLGRPSRRVEHEANAEEFLLAQPWEVDSTLSLRDRCEAVTSAPHLLSALLARSSEFGSRLTNMLLAKPVDVPAEVLEVFDEHLVWHRVYYPYIPPLASLSDRISSKFLFVLLCDLVLDLTSARLDAYRHLQPGLKSLVYHYGQATLFRPTDHRDTVTAMELLGEYRPLALVGSSPASALTNGLYSMIARSVAQRLNLAEGDALERLQWVNVLTAELEAASPLQPGFAAYAVEARLTSVDVPLYHLRRAYLLTTETILEISRNFRDLTQLGQILDAFQLPQPDLDRPIRTVYEAEARRQKCKAKGIALFLAVMSGAYPGDFAPEDVTQVSEHIIDRLKIVDRHPVRVFLEQYGESRMDELEQLVTDFVGLTDIELAGIPWAPPPRRTAAELLYTCKDMVENHAARVKGWGGFHPRVDTHLILFQEVARRLDGLARGAVDQGDLFAATAKLVRSLHGILSGWKRKLETESGSGSRAGISSGAPSAPSDLTPDDLTPDDLFGDWENWPQLESLDFADLLNAELDFSWMEWSE